VACSAATAPLCVTISTRPIQEVYGVAAADDPVATLLNVNVGDEVALAAELYEWGSPFAVIGVDEVRFQIPDSDWRARELELRSTHPLGSDYKCTIVEGCKPPRISRGHGHLVEAVIVDGPEDDDGQAVSGGDESSGEGDHQESHDRYWCGACGQGPFQERDQIREHHDRRGHAGEPSIRDTDPREDIEESPEPTTDGGPIQVQTPSASPGMPTCQNCGSRVTMDYARVFTPNDVENPRCCPDCDDVVRTGHNEVRKRRDIGAHLEDGDQQ